MGMYDELDCEMTLPGGGASIPFQTKSFDREFQHYVITKGGRLMRHTADGLERVPFTGAVRFYNYLHHVWIEYRAELEAGEVVSIRLVEGPAPQGPAG